MLIKLRNSEFPEIVQFLQSALSRLVYEVYHHLLVEELEQLLSDTKEDKAFLEPIQKSLQSYEKLKKIKEKHSDLNPYENERDLLNLYHKLESENQARMTHDIDKDKNPFLAMVKRTVIVRGNSWKEELEDEVRPLGLVSSQQWIDTRAFKNPDLFEWNLRNFEAS